MERPYADAIGFYDIMTNFNYNTACYKMQLQILKKIDENTAWKDSRLHKLLQLLFGNALHTSTEQVQRKGSHMLSGLFAIILQPDIHHADAAGEEKACDIF